MKFITTDLFIHVCANLLAQQTSWISQEWNTIWSDDNVFTAHVIPMCTVTAKVVLPKSGPVSEDWVTPLLGDPPVTVS